MEAFIKLLLTPAAIPILMFEFAVSFTLYHWFNENKYLGWLLAAWFSWQNALVNVFLMSIICWDRPRELAITKRMERYAEELDYSTRLNRWRHGWRRFICGWANKWHADHCDAS